MVPAVLLIRAARIKSKDNQKQSQQGSHKQMKLTTGGTVKPVSPVKSSPAAAAEWRAHIAVLPDG